MSAYNVINTRVPRVDARAKATGEASYAADISLPNMLYGAVLQSPLAHAKIVNIDVSGAKKLPGVRDIVTAKEAPSVRYGVSPARYDETIFCIDKARYVGDEIAAVAAEDLETARQAISLIKVEYEELPAYLDFESAMSDGAIPLHDDYPGNISAEVHQEFGNFEEAIGGCDLVRTDRFVNKRQDGGFLEPQACIAQFDLNGNLILRSSTQSVHYVQRSLSMVLGIPIGKVRVIKPYVGGGFGPKAAVNTIELASSLMSMRTGRPVKMVFSREQVFLHSRARHQFYHELTTGVKKDGTIVALKNTCYLDGGAYSSFGIATIYYAGSLLGAPYKLANMKYDGYRVYTNKPACGAQRGHGGVAARAAWEQQLDIIAGELGMDPVEFRLKNIMKTGDVTCNDFNMSSLGMKECLEAVRDGSGWTGKRGKLPKGKGIGVACGFFVSGAGYPIYRSETFHSTATIRLSEDGGIANLYTAAAEIGQGSDTILSQIAAEELGIKFEDVVVHSGDTDFGVDLGAYSSRQTLMAGHAAKAAAQDVKRQVLEALSEQLAVPVADMDIRDGRIVFSGTLPDFSPLKLSYVREHRGWEEGLPEGELTFREAARFAFLRRGVIIGNGAYKPGELGGKYKGAAVGTSPAYGCSAQIVEVSVDMETGKVTIDSMTDAHDCGFAINRTNVEGQMQGSLSMGVGEALFEEVKFDKDGRVCNASLGEYRIPTMLDMPNVKTIIIESNEPNGPFGAKEVGEGAIMPTIPAILNAIYDATGVRINELPVTSERLYNAMKLKPK
ncbi:MAG: molybdopterin cofactor-binding domain-containing protein [Syntrophorhabdaceae bacterium]